MNHSINITAEAVEITVTGRLTFKYHKEYKDFLDDLLKNEVKTFVFDLAGVEFIDSAGLGMLLIAKQKSQAQGTNVLLRRPPDNVKRMLQVAKFDKIFDIQD
jgi:anti-anti-sigma factor